VEGPWGGPVNFGGGKKVEHGVMRGFLLDFEKRKKNLSAKEMMNKSLPKRKNFLKVLKTGR